MMCPIWSNSVLFKRVVGKSKKFGVSFNKFKKRHFCLTTHNLFYTKGKDKPMSWNLAVADIRAVEKLREDSFKMKHVSSLVNHVFDRHRQFMSL